MTILYKIYIDDTFGVGFFVQIKQIVLESLINFEYFLQDGYLVKSFNLVDIDIYSIFSGENLPN